MKTQRFIRHLFIAGFLSLLLAAPAMAATRTRETISINKTGVNQYLSDACGFTVTRHIEGTLRITTQFDANGTYSGEVDQSHLHGSFSANGITRTYVIAERDAYTVNRDGSATEIITGLSGRITVPHQGLVTADVGRLVLSYSGPDDQHPDVTFEAG